MREREQPDHRATGMAVIAGGEQCLEGAGVGLAREQMVPINEVEQRHGLSAQGMDHVSIVDDVAMLVGSLRRPTAPQGEERRRTEETFESIVVEANAQMMALEARGHGVKHLAQHKAARGCHQHPRLLEVAGAMLGQLFECWALELETLAVLGIVAPDHLIDELAIGGKIRKVA